ncbi:reverse transcriptase domain-containing protein [Serratia fonticola]|uniref:Reverse transcriptase domain-containing protein n=1 Tax=Serratia fonticola TaxID=47917 RepID=A0AAE7JV10_SERFO|nr:reverse transcriptase domain-containing protein [Serratia fonticola]QKJ60698.1 reverse transcriptase domain-containing protein [Serratia fonticola]
MSKAASDWLAAYLWLYKRRRHAPPNADIWHLRFHWQEHGEALYQQVCSGNYRLQPMQLHRRYDNSWVQWCAQDALVLKWVAWQVEHLLPTHQRCVHLKGRGGGQKSVAQVWRALTSGEYAFVYRTDIRGYYRHIRKTQVLSLVQQHVADPVLTGLIEQYVHYSVEEGGEIFTPQHGICRGCALSPLIGASLLHHVDSDFAAQAGTFYLRYMDDFVLFARTRWQLRRCVKQLHHYFNLAGFETHPDKTQLGRIEQGFDWLGVWFTPEGTAIAPRALENYRIQRLRLYEQARRRGLSTADCDARVQAYDVRWNRWANTMHALCRPASHRSESR